jgi:hypothetical protein
MKLRTALPRTGSDGAVLEYCCKGCGSGGEVQFS